MTRTITIWILAMLSTAGTMAAQTAGDGATTGAHDVTLGPPSGDGPAVTLGFEGKVYGDTGWWLDTLDDGRLDEFERFVREIVSVNRDGDLEAMLGLWHPEEREALRASAEDGLFARNQGFFKSVEQSALRARVDYGDFHIFFVQHDSSQTETGATVNVYPMRRSGDRLFMTNGLRGDLAFRYLVQVYRGRLIEQPVQR